MSVVGALRYRQTSFALGAAGLLFFVVAAYERRRQQAREAVA